MVSKVKELVEEAERRSSLPFLHVLNYTEMECYQSDRDSEGIVYAIGRSTQKNYVPGRNSAMQAEPYTVYTFTKWNGAVLLEHRYSNNPKRLMKSIKEYKF